MPTDHRPKSQPGDTLESAQLNMLRERGPEVIDPRISTIPHVGQVLSPIAPEEFARESSLWGKGGQVSFVGQIVPHGLLGELEEPDYEDSRYWIREIWESSPPEHPATEPPHWLIDPNENVDPENNNPIRWITATNLAEINVADPSSETHGVAATTLDDGRIIKVDRILSQDGTPRFLFNAPATSGTAFCVIVELPSRAAQTLTIKWVVPKTVDNTFLFEKVGEPELVMIWPGQRGRHFRGLEVDRSVGFVVPGDNVLAAYQVGGMWYVKQAFQQTTLFPSPIANASDCQPHGALQ